MESIELVTCGICISWKFNYLCYFYQGTNELGTPLPNVDNITLLEPESSVLSYNINDNGTADICDRTETKIVGGSKASQGDFPYQVNHSEPTEQWELQIRGLERKLIFGQK